MSEPQSSGASAPVAIPNQKKAPATQAQMQGQFGKTEPSRASSAKLPDSAKPEALEKPQATFTGTKHKVKLDGEDLEVDYDELVRGYQKSQASAKRFEEANRLAASAKQIQAKLESGDIGFLVDKLGPQKARDLFENFLIEQMEYDSLPEAEKRARQLEQENKSLKTQQEEAKKAYQEREKRAAMAQAHQEIDAEVSEALESLGKQASPKLVVRIIDDMIARMDAKNERISAKDAARYAIKGIHADIAEYLPQLPVEEAVKMLPKEFLDKIRKYEVDQVLGDKQQRRVKIRPASSAKQKFDPNMSFDQKFESRFKKQPR